MGGGSRGQAPGHGNNAFRFRVGTDAKTGQATRATGSSIRIYNIGDSILMSKVTFVACLVLFLIGCDTNQQTLGLREAVLRKLKDDPDLKDYKLEPAAVADCVVEAISDDAPGIPGDPRREEYFKAYAHIMSVNTPTEAEKILEQYKEFFGSAQGVREAALKVTDHIMTCMGEAIEERGE